MLNIFNLYIKKYNVFEINMLFALFIILETSKIEKLFSMKDFILFHLILLKFDK